MRRSWMKKSNTLQAFLILTEELQENLWIRWTRIRNVNILLPKDQMNESLLKRKKSQYLSDAQIFHIIKQLDLFPISGRLLQKMYKLFQSMMRRNINKNKNKQFEDITLSRFQEKKRISKEAQLATRSYLLPLCEPKSIPMIKHRVRAERVLSNFWNKVLQQDYWINSKYKIKLKLNELQPDHLTNSNMFFYYVVWNTFSITLKFLLHVDCSLSTNPSLKWYRLSAFHVPRLHTFHPSARLYRAQVFCLF